MITRTSARTGEGMSLQRVSRKVSISDSVAFSASWLSAQAITSSHPTDGLVTFSAQESSGRSLPSQVTVPPTALTFFTAVRRAWAAKRRAKRTTMQMIAFMMEFDFDGRSDELGLDAECRMVPERAPGIRVQNWPIRSHSISVDRKFRSFRAGERNFRVPRIDGAKVPSSPHLIFHHYHAQNKTITNGIRLRWPWFLKKYRTTSIPSVDTRLSLLSKSLGAIIKLQVLCSKERIVFIVTFLEDKVVIYTERTKGSSCFSFCSHFDNLSWKLLRSGSIRIKILWWKGLRAIR